MVGFRVCWRDQVIKANRSLLVTTPTKAQHQHRKFVGDNTNKGGKAESGVVGDNTNNGRTAGIRSWNVSDSRQFKRKTN
jgi:hypothetical protein